MGNLLQWPLRHKEIATTSRSLRMSRTSTRSRSCSPCRETSRSLRRSRTSTRSRSRSRSRSPSREISACERKWSDYDFIPASYTALEQVAAALKDAGLESSNLIFGMDFTKSNEWTGKISFNNRSLHALGDIPNPYEKAIFIIGKTLAPFDEDNLIHCFGFGDATTHDQEVFSFHNDNSPCHGFEEVLSCYRRIVPSLRLSGFDIYFLDPTIYSQWQSDGKTPLYQASKRIWCVYLNFNGPTSFGPIVEAAVDIVEKTGGKYHVLVIIADGQVTRTIDTDNEDLSPQEKRTINSIIYASSYPLSIVLIGVGDGPWNGMKEFENKLPARDFKKFQFVNFTNIMSKDVSLAEKETAFALAALKKIPIQYRASMEFGICGRVTGKAKNILPRPPPPIPFKRTTYENTEVCPICLSNRKELAFGCGHMTCLDCGKKLSTCFKCRATITSRLRLYTG